MEDSGLSLTLTIGASAAEKYTIEDKSNQKLVFNSSGYLVKVKDADNKTLSITYSGNKISKITDGSGRNVTLSYDSSGYLSKVVSPEGTKSFTYTNGCLTKITDIDGKAVSYTYNGQRLLTNMRNIDAYNISYGYSAAAPYRVISVQEKAGTVLGQSYTASYYGDVAYFEDNNGHEERYSFNDIGNTVIVSDEKGYAQTSKYITADGAAKNKISKASKLQYTVVQMLKNPNVTSLDSWTGGVSGNASYALNTAASGARVGSKSLKVTAAGTGSGWFSQKVSVKKGQDYTFSAYVRPDSALIQSGGSVVRIRYKNKSGSDVYAESSSLIPCGDGWYRLECTAQIPSDSTSTDAYVFVMVQKQGTAYFDCLQMETGKTASRYNLIENGDFTQGLTGFTLSGTKAFDHLVDTDYPDASKPSMTYETGVVTTDVLNVRSGPGTGNGIVTSVRQNQQLYILGSASDSSGTVWYHITWASGQRVYYGYASSAYIRKNSSAGKAAMAEINTSVLNVRNGAGTGYSVLTSLAKASQVYILQNITSTAGQTWYMIYFTKSGTKYVGCVLSDYVLTHESVTETISEVPAVHGCGLDNQVLMLYGNPGGIKRATQTVAVSGSAGDAFVVNAWGTGKGVTYKDNRHFGVEVEFVYADGSKDTPFVSDFLDRGVGWVFLNDAVVAKKAYTAVKVSYIYAYNENAVYFDGLSLYKEEYGSSFTYDSEGNVVSTADAAKKTNSFTYDGSNNLTKLVDARGSNFTYSYDDKHHVTGAVSAADMCYSFSYNSFGLPTQGTVFDPADASNYIKTVAGYDSSGNYMTSLTDPLGNKVQYSYDASKGRLLKVTDAKGTETGYNYNTYGQLTTVTADNVTLAGGQTVTPYVSYGYGNDRLSHVGWHGMEYTLDYDGFGNQISVKQGEHTLASYSYDVSTGNMTKQTYGNGVQILYSYDEFDRIIKTSYKASANASETVLYTYLYRKDGNLAQVYDAAEQKTYRYYYDLADRLVKAVDSDGCYYVQTYDKNNNLVKVEDGDDANKYVTEYTYDADNRETATKAGGKTYTTTYDALGRIERQSWNTSSPLAANRSYAGSPDMSGSQSTQLAVYSDGSSRYVYTYDENGNMTQITDSRGTTKYYYDEINQMYREDNHQTDETVVYTYDGAGNIVSKKTYPLGGPVSGTPLKTVSYGYDAEWTDKMTSYDGAAVTYDAIGNPLSYRGKTLSWVQGRRLSSVTSGQTAYSYSYNVDGMRSSKKNTVTGEVTSYQLSGGIITGETVKNSSGTVTAKSAFVYDSSGSVIAMQYNGTWYFYRKNGQGDITGIADSSGNTVVDYVYDSWGKTVSVTGNTALGNANPFRYRGYYYDRETGFYYLRSRYYDPETCRFINADGYVTTGQGILGHNMFAYCGNNPVNRVDEDGAKYAILFAGIGAVVNKVTRPKKIGTTSYGTNVYMHSSVESYQNYVKTSNVPEVHAIDLRKEANPDIRVLESYTIMYEPYQREVIRILIKYNNENPVYPAWERTESSMVYEWDVHNAGYRAGRIFSLVKETSILARTKDVDFDNAEEGKGYIHFFLKAILH